MPPRFGGAPKCPRCDKFVYMAEQVLGPNSVYYHRACFTCKECNKSLDSTTMAEREGQAYCKTCYNRQWGPKGYGSGGLSFMHTETKTAKEVLAESDWAAEQAVATSKASTNFNQAEFQPAPPQQAQPAPSLPARPTNNAPSLPSRPVVTKNASAPPAIPPKPSTISERPGTYVNSRTGYVPKKLSFQVNSDLCAKCDKPVYAVELILGAGKKYHKMCFRCLKCNKLLDSTSMVDKGFDIYCRPCYSKDFGPKGYGYGGLLSTEGATR
ncbi:hypothetical protein BC943DRAFT_329636 [Umbelopsis sp. AD052]|nr:hypothetical protein BC943DRAFT_329636 [Umbelopsis sp. AD052]